MGEEAVMTPVGHVLERLAGLTHHREPWCHATADDFLPAEVFAETLELLPRLRLGPKFGQGRQRVSRMPGSLADLLHEPVILDAIRQQSGFTGGTVLAEIAWFGRLGYPIHSDRHDKLWNGQVYLAGDPKGTELFDAQGTLQKVVEWQPNRLTCWLPPGGEQKHAAPVSEGRWVLLWWLLRGRG